MCVCKCVCLSMSKSQSQDNKRQTFGQDVETVSQINAVRGSRPVQLSPEARRLYTPSPISFSRRSSLNAGVGLQTRASLCPGVCAFCYTTAAGMTFHVMLDLCSDSDNRIPGFRSESSADRVRSFPFLHSKGDQPRRSQARSGPARPSCHLTLLVSVRQSV